jgi:hypothetical protein
MRDVRIYVATFFLAMFLLALFGETVAAFVNGNELAEAMFGTLALIALFSLMVGE